MRRGASISIQICVLCILYVSVIPHLKNGFKNSKMKSLIFFTGIHHVRILAH